MRLDLFWPLPVILALASCASEQPESVIAFDRDLSNDQPVLVNLQWVPNPTKYYTPRGQMTVISIKEGSEVVSLPREAISGIQDVWPDRVQLTSSIPGNYELRIPSGVGEGSLDVFRIENFDYSERIALPTQDYPELQRQTNKSEMATPRKPSD